MRNNATLSVLVFAILGAGCVADGDIADPPVDDPVEDPTGDPPVDPADPPTPAEAAERVLDQWMRCMNLDDFRAANMVTWGSIPVTQGTCASCHGNGEVGFFASRNEVPFFTALAEDRYHTLQYFSVDLTLGVEQARMIVNEAGLRQVGSGAAPHQEHPRFDTVMGPGVTALRAFYDRTVIRLGTPACTPPLS